MLTKLLATIFPLLKPPAALVALKLSAFVAVMIPATFMIGVPIQDPWFDAFTLFYIFSAITSGMPEPTHESSFGYVWLYRSAHILSANATPYFAARSKWKEITEVSSDLD